MDPARLTGLNTSEADNVTAQWLRKYGMLAPIPAAVAMSGEE